MLGRDKWVWRRSMDRRELGLAGRGGGQAQGVSEAASTARFGFEIRKLRARAASVRLGAGGR